MCGVGGAPRCALLRASGDACALSGAGAAQTCAEPFSPQLPRIFHFIKLRALGRISEMVGYSCWHGLCSASLYGLLPDYAYNHILPKLSFINRTSLRWSLAACSQLLC